MKKFIFLTLLPLFVAVIVGITVFNWANQRQQLTDTSSTNIILPPTSDEVEAKINEFRTSRQLATFNSNVPALDQAAQVRAENMCRDKDWSHAKDWDTLTPYYSYSYAGENLYFGYLQQNQAARAVHDWVASPTHLENLVGNYTEIGVGVTKCPGFQNEPTAVIITNYFGVPR